jgi:predicted permease
MSAPRWANVILRCLAGPDPNERDVLLGDLEEAHRARVAKRGAVVAAIFMTLEVADLVLMLIGRRVGRAVPRLSWLDIRVGARLLLRYPVLTVVGAGSVALAIALGASVFAFITLMLWPRLPLPDGDRIVIVSHTDEATSQGESRVTADFFRWREGTGTLTDLAAGRGLALNLTMGDGLREPVTVAEVTASMFSMTRVAPIMGRVLREADAEPSAQAVMVLGERLWRERFGSTPGIVGQTLMLGDTPTLVIGVMPAAYRFPSVYEIWQPLTLDRAAAPRSGMGIRIWARLKPGVTAAQANAELAVLSADAAVDWPATHAHLRAVVLPVATSRISDPGERAWMASLNLAACALVLLVSGNVALLMFARAATRESEMVVRTALGASRARLVAQFCAESLVLNAVAAEVGLWVAGRALTWGVTTVAVVANDGEWLPFWITPDLPPVSIAYGVGLALLATAMTGILPALKMTRGISSRLRQRSAGGGGLKFGGVWTLLIVGQIALSVFAPSMVFALHWEASRLESEEIGVPAEQFLTARLGPGTGMSRAQFDAAVRRVRDELAGLPGVVRVALADKLPFMWHGYDDIDVDEGGTAVYTSRVGVGRGINTAAVAPEFFALFDAPPIAGRLLTAADEGGMPQVVVVNQSFVERVLGGRNAVGRRIRYRRAGNGGQRQTDPDEQPWLEIVGVVRDLAMVKPDSPNSGGAYLPLDLHGPDAATSVRVAARVSGDMTTATNSLRSIVAAADSALRLSDVRPLDQARTNETTAMSYAARVFGTLSAAAAVLALSGIYAVMSFAVSRRTREIGIRTALGARRSHVALTILRRPMIHMAIGILVGIALTSMWIESFGLTAAYVAGTAGYFVVAVIIGLLACIAPARRAMRVDPIAALRND